MIHEGFGKTKEILNEIKGRDDFVEAVKTLNDNEESTDGEYFDIRSLITDEEDDNEIDDIMNLPDGTYGGLEVKHF